MAERVDQHAGHVCDCDACLNGAARFQSSTAGVTYDAQEPGAERSEPVKLVSHGFPSRRYRPRKVGA